MVILLHVTLSYSLNCVKKRGQICPLFCCNFQLIVIDTRYGSNKFIVFVYPPPVYPKFWGKGLANLDLKHRGKLRLAGGASNKKSTAEPNCIK